MRNVIITGANRGIGKSMLENFCRNGYNVWACSRNKNQEFEEYTKELANQNGVIIRHIYFDMTDEDSMKSAVDKIFADKQSIDVLINNAGVTTVGLLMQSKIEDIRSLFEVNYFSVLRLTQLIAKKMITQRNGVIINMTSLAGIESQPGKIAYGSSKAALILMTRCLAKELGPLGIRVNGIAPGPIQSEMIQQYSEDVLSKLKTESSLRRLGEPDEIAKTALFLASDNASYINGEIIKVDGGR